MARYTRPVPGRSTTYANAGPYSGDQWAELLNILHIGDGNTDRGPFASYLNRLEVTNPAGAQFQIDTGAGLANGHLMINDAAVTITADTPAANPRIDRVCMVYNNTNAAINATTVGAFTFNVAGGGTSIPAYTCELAIMKGAEAGAPVLPALEQDVARLWMVELARYQISVVPAITNFTDYRDYADAITKKVIVNPIMGYDLSAVADLNWDIILNYISPSIAMTGSNDCIVYGRWRVPEDFIGELNILGICAGEIGGWNIYVRNSYYSGGCGEENGVNSQAGVLGAEALGVSRTGYSCHGSLDVLDANIGSIGDIVTLQFERDATNVLDTLAAISLKFQGFLLEYLGYRR